MIDGVIDVRVRGTVGGGGRLSQRQLPEVSAPVGATEIDVSEALALHLKFYPGMNEAESKSSTVRLMHLRLERWCDRSSMRQ